MGICIDTDKEQTYYNLDNYSDDDYLTETPSSFMVVIMYHVILQCGGINYMLLEYDNYAAYGNESYELNRHTFWTSPLITFSIDSRKNWRYRPTRIGKIKSLYKKILKDMKNELSILENQLLYRLGVSDCEIKPSMGRPYIEYKRSSLQTGQMKCYYIIEKFLCDLDQISKYRLSDPEGMYGYHYLPLTGHTECDYEGENGVKSFLDKEIPRNTLYRIHEYKNLFNAVNVIETKDLYCTLSGFLIKLDMIDFTNFYNHLRDNAFNLDENGETVAHDFISRIAGIYEQELQENGICQYVIEGDGFTAAFPCKTDTELQTNSLNSILLMIENIHKRLCYLIVNSKKKWVGLRCVILYADQYNYGKIDGLNNLRPGFSGEQLIVLSRMEQELHQSIRSRENYELSEQFRYFSGIIIGIDNGLCSQFDYTQRGYIHSNPINEDFRGAHVSMSFFIKGDIPKLKPSSVHNDTANNIDTAKDASNKDKINKHESYERREAK